jgi:hypothetical protein
MLTPHHLPWTWPESFRNITLEGTKLAPVVENKVKRIQQKYKEILLCNDNNGGYKLDMFYRDYMNLNASTVVARQGKFLDLICYDSRPPPV